MYHLFSFPRDEKDKRQMLILDVINFVFTSKQSYKFLSIVKGIIYWSATLQYQDEFLCFSRQSNLCYTVFKIFANKQKSFLQVVFRHENKGNTLFSCSKNCAAWMKWEDKQGPYCLNGRAKNESFSICWWTF